MARDPCARKTIANEIGYPVNLAEPARGCLHSGTRVRSLFINRVTGRRRGSHISDGIAPFAGAAAHKPRRPPQDDASDEPAEGSNSGDPPGRLTTPKPASATVRPALVLVPLMEDRPVIRTRSRYFAAPRARSSCQPRLRLQS